MQDLQPDGLLSSLPNAPLWPDSEKSTCERGAGSPDSESRLRCFLFEVTSGRSLSLCEPQSPTLLDARTERKPAPLTWPVL